MDDWQLIETYINEKSEDAFRTLVERYAGMVYHAALRQTGDPHAAEDAAQTVFIALAQKAARIPRQATLFGWLFRATRFAVLKQNRQNINRSRREQEAHAMQSISPDDSNILWEQLGPHLDDALDKLSRADREMILIRFFGNKSHRDVAETFGLTEENARKRISRSIEKLRAIFSKKGIALSAVTLTAALALGHAEAAPAGAASAWTKISLAKAAAGTTAATFGLALLFQNYAKTVCLIAGVAGITILGILTFQSKPATISIPAPLRTNQSVAKILSDPVALLPNIPNTNRIDPAAIAAALDKIKAALHNPDPTKVYPDTNMVAAIDELGPHKKSALPILEAALKEEDIQVRMRAIDGLGSLGEAAKETSPLFLKILQDGGFGETNRHTMYRLNTGGVIPGFQMGTESDCVILFSWAKIHPPLETLSGIAHLMQTSPVVCQIMASASGSFIYSSRPAERKNWIWMMSGKDSKVINHAFTPLLEDPNPEVRYAACSALTTSLGSEADAKIFRLAIELLESGDDSSLRLQGMSRLEQGSINLGYFDRERNLRKSMVNAVRLGTNLNEIVTALADIAYHSGRPDLRLQASRILEAVTPDFQKNHPSLAETVNNEDAIFKFNLQVRNHQIEMPDIIAGLKKFPKAAPEVAEILAKDGTNAHAALPTLNEALIALAPDPDKKASERFPIIQERTKLANAMQKIAPELPKPLFTGDDVSSIYTKILFTPQVRENPDRRKTLSEIRESVGWPTHIPADVSPDVIRRLLSALKDADTIAYNALLAKINETDPHFFDVSPP